MTRETQKPRLRSAGQAATEDRDRRIPSAVLFASQWAMVLDAMELYKNDLGAGTVKHAEAVLIIENLERQTKPGAKPHGK
jgi:hypothetical protein